MLILLLAACVYAAWRLTLSLLRGLPRSNEDMVFF